MVNCKNCGAPLSLDQAYCPHCGTPNPEAQEHLKKLAQLDRSFQKTKIEVVDEVRKSKKGYGLLVILIMVLLANLMLIPLFGASYEISEKIIASKMNKAEITETLDDLLERGEYIELSVFTDKFSLPYQEYGGYNQVSYMADYYNRVIDNVTNYLYGKDLYEDPLVRACQYMIEFRSEYKHCQKRDYYAQMGPYIEDLNDEFESFVKTYLKLTDEDIGEIDEMSSGELLLRVNERLNHEEE